VTANPQNPAEFFAVCDMMPPNPLGFPMDLSMAQNQMLVANGFVSFSLRLVPEPSGLLLVGLAAGFGLRRRRVNDEG
jgi:hypothetical protein